MRAKRMWRIIGLLAFGIALSACHQNGTVFAVDTTDDTVDANPGDGLCADAAGDCSLRAAVMEANALPGIEEVALVDGGTYPLSEALRITAPVVITGDGGIEGSDVVVAAPGGLTEFDGPDFPGGFAFNRLTVADGSVVSIRHADLSGRYVHLESGSLTVWSSSFVAGFFGGIHADAGSVRVENATITGFGAGAVVPLVRSTDAAVHIISSTLTGGEVSVTDGGTGSIQVQSSIFDVTCGDGVTSLGHNMTSGGSCAFGQPGDVDGGPDPLAGELRDNGGEVLTLLPGALTPAVDGGLPGACTIGNIDARGLPRPVGPACDIGAVEIQYGADCATPGPGADLRSCPLAGANLAGLDLSGADATDAVLEGADLTGATLVGAVLTGADLTDALLTDADLTDADLSDTLGAFYADGANFTRADLRNAVVHRADGADFTDADGRGFSTSYLTGSMSGAHIEGADFTGATFWAVTSGGITGNAIFSQGVGVLGGYLIDRFVVLNGVDLSGLDVGDISFGRTGLIDSDLTGLRINPAWAAVYDGSILDETDWSGSYAENTIARDINLVGANLTGTMLASSDLTGAVIVGTDFTDANLASTAFTNAILLQNTWANTICPSGVNSDDNGGNCDGQFTDGAPSVGGGASVPAEFEGMGVEDFLAGGVVDE